MAWGSDTTLGSQSAVNDSVEEYLPSSGGISLNPGERCHVQLIFNNESGSVTNGCLWSIYTTLDDTTEVWDHEPYMAGVYYPDTVAAEEFSIVLSDVYKFRIGFLAAAATDDYTVSGYYRKDGVSL